MSRLAFESINLTIGQVSDNEQDKYKLLYDNSPVMQLSIEPVNAIVIDCNQTTINKTGYSKGEIIGKPVFRLYHKDSLNTVSKALSIFQKTGFVTDVEVAIATKSGKKLPVLLNTEAIRDEQGKILYSNSTWKDISEIKDLQDKLMKANEDLEKKVAERTQELEARNKELEQFVYIASHDLQEPLRTISSYIELLVPQIQGRLTEEEFRHVNIISQSAKRMRKLVKGLLDYARIGKEVSLNEVDTEMLVKSVIEDLSLKVSETGAEIMLGELPAIRVFETGFRMLFQNLISNALKFKREEINPRIQVNAKNVEGYWQFSICDNGIGIAEENKEKVFKIFRRLYNRSKFDGTGIGLAQCQKIIDLHNGKIWLDSELNFGTTFYFNIPKNL